MIPEDGFRAGVPRVGGAGVAVDDSLVPRPKLYRSSTASALNSASRSRTSHLQLQDSQFRRPGFARSGVAGTVAMPLSSRRFSEARSSTQATRSDDGGTTPRARVASVLSGVSLRYRPPAGFLLRCSSARLLDKLSSRR